MAFLRLATGLAIILLVMFLRVSSAQNLIPSFYNRSCPTLPSIVHSVIKDKITKDPRMGASLLRLHFHDCFVNGCDGSVLLDGKSAEKEAGPNKNSARGFDVIDIIKAKVESACRGTVSCADILALAAKESVGQLHGPSWNLPLGRRDSLKSRKADADSDLPSPTMSVNALLKIFSKVGLDTTDFVALSGAHTIGQAHCTNFRDRIYNEKNIDTTFAKTAQKTCPRSSRLGTNIFEPLDIATPTKFDNSYYKNLMDKKGLLHSDQILYGGGLDAKLVAQYRNSEQLFFSAFASAMVKMGNISPLTGRRGEIRKICSKINSN